MQGNKEILEQLGMSLEQVGKVAGLCSGKIAMTGLPAPNIEAFHDAACKVMEAQQAPQTPAPKVTKMNRKQRRTAAKKAIKGRAKEQHDNGGEPVTHYVCDPSLNVMCKKQSCHLNGGPCRHTKYLEFAKQPVEKARIVIPVSGKERTELMKQYTEELKGV